MKPFNLEEALAGKPVVTRDGRPVTGLHLFEGCTENSQPLFGVVDSHISCWYPTGEYHTQRRESGLDLFMAPTKRTVWVNIYGDGKYFGSCAYTTQVEADKRAKDWRLGGKAHPIEIEE